jgi:hypothetical protein
MTVVALNVPKFSLNFVFNFDLHVTFSWPTELPLIGLHTIVVTMGVVVIQYALQIARWSYIARLMSDSPVSASATTEWPCDGQDSSVRKKDIVFLKKAKPGSYCDRAVKKADIIKAGPVTTGGATELRTGDKVKARCKGSKEHYAGEIDVDNGNGTYGVQFGQAHGQKVKARCKGSPRHYPGKIHSINKNGTYCVKFGAYTNRLHYFAAPAIHWLGQWTLWPLVTTVTLLRKVENFSLRKGCFAQEEASDEIMLKAVTVRFQFCCCALPAPLILSDT